MQDKNAADDTTAFSIQNGRLTEISGVLAYNPAKVFRAGSPDHLKRRQRSDDFRPVQGLFPCLVGQDGYALLSNR